MNRSLIVLLTFTTLSIARLNPFEPLSIPNEAISDTSLKPIPVDGKIMSDDDGTRTVKIISDEPMKKKSSKVSKDKLTPNNIVEMKKDENLTKKTQVTKVKAIKIIKPKVQVKLVEKIYNILPFLSLDLKKNQLVITSRTKYKIIKYYREAKENKIILDFKGNVKHYTKRGSFISEEFEKFIVGNHPKEGFFRVVIITKSDVNDYKVTIKDNIAILTCK